MLELLYKVYGMMGKTLMKFDSNFPVYLFYKIILKGNLKIIPWIDLFQDGSII